MKGFYVSEGLREALSGKNIFLDTDFLSTLINDDEALQDFLEISQNGFLLIDPLVRFELLRDAQLPERRRILEEFLSYPVLIPALEHPDIFKKIRENALTLSYLYAHKGFKGASTVDLHLAGRVIQHSNSLLITGNKKDFPLVFDTLGALIHESETDIQVRAYPILSFSKEKYKAVEDDWRKVPLSAR
ncbi:hypothetical protein K8Q93_01115 [Candidatus Parcubacteria bacterium]|nr:hypothetical protein [Candidatus Parcubacteria bacterium]